MKCEVCLELLEEYLDGELPQPEHVEVGEHLIACGDCSAGFAELTAEQELFARYDREVEVPPFLWTRIAAHTIAESNGARNGWYKRVAAIFATPVASAIVVLLLAIAVGLVYVISRQPAPKPIVATTPKDPTLPRNGTAPNQVEDPKSSTIKNDLNIVASHPKPKRRAKPPINRTATDQSDVFSSNLGYLDIDDLDTARHIEQSQNLLRSIRNVPVSDNDEEIDVTYDKALSRRLLNENVVLRRDAEMKAKFPTKTLLTDLEPFLIDIANLPDRARPEDVRAIKERVKKTEIVAALIDYQDRGTNNR
ncbi:MAG TPA: zf-HC2 domain-containing protein [Pyrinomonadaceae bacterium]